MKSFRVLTLSTINENIKRAEYAVRGTMVIRAQEHEKTLRTNPSALPFKRITYCNIGNPQQLGQKPLTFIRQVISLVEYPDLLTKPGIENLYPTDAIKRAKSIIDSAGSTGAYSESQGRLHVRENIAKFIKKRDGFSDDTSYTTPDDIFLTDGASPGVQTCMKLLIRDPKDGVMIPIPQYPLYSATIPLVGGTIIPYYLEESKNWALDMKDLKTNINKARESGLIPRGLVVINPGNPTGSCLTEKNMEDILKFCHEEKILLLADEVYQENVYVKDKKPFISFKKKLSQMPPEIRDLELISFHSTSKGVTGECGKRGGYFELTNVLPEVKTQIYKTLSVNLCPNITGQITMDIMVAPPAPGEQSYSLYKEECDQVYNSLKRRAKLVVDRLNTLPGIVCQPPEGAMYAFPKITLSQSAIDAANKQGIAPDLLYCLKLLDQTGLCVVPGSGFGQKDGEYHFRTTFLPSEDHLNEVLEEFAKFHHAFIKEYQ